MTRPRSDKYPALGNLVRAYIPLPPTKYHIVAIAYGVILGGFIGGMSAASYDRTPFWLDILCSILGSLFGMIISLSIVPKDKQ